MLKHILIVAVCSISTTMLCSDNHNYQVGCVDRLVLKEIVASQGFDAVKDIVQRHAFVISQGCDILIVNDVTKQVMPRSESLLYIPLTFTEKCSKEIETELSKEVFKRIDSEVVHEVGAKSRKKGNPLNIKHNTGYRVDYCSSAETDDGKDIGSAKRVTVTTRFFDQKSLLAALETLKQQ